MKTLFSQSQYSYEKIMPCSVIVTNEFYFLVVRTSNDKYTVLNLDTNIIARAVCDTTEELLEEVKKDFIVEKIIPAEKIMVIETK